MSPSVGSICCGNKFAARKQENVFMPKVKNICSFPDTNFASETHVSQRSLLASTSVRFTSFQCCSLKMFLRNAEHTAMADGKVEVEKLKQAIE